MCTNSTETEKKQRNNTDNNKRLCVQTIQYCVRKVCDKHRNERSEAKSDVVFSACALSKFQSFIILRAVCIKKRRRRTEFQTVSPPPQRKNQITKRIRTFRIESHTHRHIKWILSFFCFSCCLFRRSVLPKSYQFEIVTECERRGWKRERKEPARANERFSGRELRVECCRNRTMSMCYWGVTRYKDPFQLCELNHPGEKTHFEPTNERTNEWRVDNDSLHIASIWVEKSVIGEFCWAKFSSSTTTTTTNKFAICKSKSFRFQFFSSPFRVFFIYFVVVFSLTFLFFFPKLFFSIIFLFCV